MNKRIVEADADGLFQLVRVCSLGRKTASSSSSFSAIRNGFLGGEFDTLCSEAVEGSRKRPLGSVNLAVG